MKKKEVRNKRKKLTFNKLFVNVCASFNEHHKEFIETYPKDSYSR